MYVKDIGDLKLEQKTKLALLENQKNEIEAKLHQVYQEKLERDSEVHKLKMLNQNLEREKENA